MATITKLRPDPSPSDEEVGVRSDVWPVQLAARPDPSPVAFAIHDAKNMVGVLSANLEVLRRTIDSMQVPQGATDAMSDIEEATRRLGGLLREALGALQGREPARATPGKLRVTSVVESTVSQMRPAARAKGVRIEESGAYDTQATIAPDLFGRVLVNLLENAVRFSKPGDKVEVSYENRRGRMVLAIGDHGPGLPDGAHDQIFESYRRPDAHEGGSHYGLGLAFCREVARAHGGDAWAFNRQDGGACFVFEIQG